jgi:uncharacterized membrane protein YjjB (DUF3815 family)
MTIENMAAQALFGFLATMGFAVLFNVPRATLFTAGLVGAVGHVVRYVLRDIGVSNEVATYIGALTVGLFGYWQAVRFHLPRLVFTVTGIISMVPGIPAYEMMVYFSNGDILGGIQSAVKAGLVGGAIAAGLSTARILTETEWLRVLERTGEGHEGHRSDPALHTHKQD